jgi:arginine/ornithine transport system permease protein
MNTRFFELLFKALGQCARALPLTLSLLATSVVAGLCLALPMSIPYSRRKGASYRAIGAFVYLFTGTPLLVQVYVLYHGMPTFGVVRSGMQAGWGGFLRGAFFWVWLALTLNTAAYTTEIFSGAIRNTDPGEVEAAHAAGFTSRQVMRRIVLPSGLRRALPAYSNEVLMLLHATSLASTVTLYEVTGKASQFNSTYFAPFSAFGAAAVLYLCLTFCFVTVFRLAERRFLRHLHH